MKRSSKAGTVDYVPSAYREDFTYSRTDLAVIIFSLAVLPACFLVCSALPPTWMFFNIEGIRRWTSRQQFEETYGESSREQLTRNDDIWHWHVSSSKALNFVPDVSLYYGLIMACVVSAYLSRKSIWFRIEMRRSRVLPGDVIISQGEWVCICVFVPVFLLWCVYWFKSVNKPFHGHDYNGNRFQRLSRGFARMSACLLGLSLFPATRNSLWTQTFGMSFEAANKFHRFFAHAFILALSVHVIMWIVFLFRNVEFFIFFIFIFIFFLKFINFLIFFL